MLYTGNANKFIWYAAIPLIFIGYTSFHFWSYTFDNQHTSNASANHKAQLIKLKALDGLILGGSNSLSGLSATMMSDALDKQWYNLSLGAEGGSDERYWEFIEASAPEEIREKVKSIVYSSATGFNDRIKQRTYYLSRPLLAYLLSNKSIVSHIKTYLIPDENLSLNKLSKLGDKEFSPTECQSEILTILRNSRNIDGTELSTWVLSQLKVLKGLFPNAVIFFVIPSEFYSNIDLKRSIENAAAINAAISTFRSNNDIIITLVNQPSYLSIDMLCNDGLHANPSGRVWRTNNLLDSFSSIELPPTHNNSLQ